jgi:hypothetical protein
MLVVVEVAWYRITVEIPLLKLRQLLVEVEKEV